MADRTLSKIRSFVLRQGRLTKGQATALEKGWPLYGRSIADGQVSYPEIFKNEHPVVLEIGFGMGDSLAEQATADPGTNYIGIEVHKPGVGHLLMACLDSELSNVRIFVEDSMEVMTQVLPANQLDVVQLFFPDPWPKKKHHKRRIVNNNFLDLVREKLKPKGLLHIASDWQPYIEHIEELMAKRTDYQAEAPPARPTTKFEVRGQKLGHQITDLAYSTVPVASI